MSLHRLFVALRPPKDIRSLALRAMHGVPGARWQDDAQLHITLRYIGEVDARLAEDVLLALSRVRAAPLTLGLAGVGQFDGRQGGRALWAGIAPREAVTQLHQKIDRALARAGLQPEGRAFLPHMTVARLGRSSGLVDPWLVRHAALTSPTFQQTHFELYESRLGADGSNYELIERWPLTA